MGEYSSRRCRFCGRLLSGQPSLVRHLTTCPVRADADNSSQSSSSSPVLDNCEADSVSMEDLEFTNCDSNSPAVAVTDTDLCVSFQVTYIHFVANLILFIIHCSHYYH